MMGIGITSSAGLYRALLHATDGLALRVIGLLLTLSLLGGCGTSLAPPTITDTTNAPWATGVAREFRAVTDVPSAWKIDAVYVRYARHHWPGPQVAHDALASSNATIPGGFKAVGPDLAAAPASHHLFYEWFLDYSPAGGGQSATVSSGPQDFVIGCTPGMTNSDLLAAQASILARFNTATPHFDLPLLGFSVQPHYNVSLGGNGVGFASPTSGAIGSGPGMPTSIQLTNPAILLYQPRDPFPNETPAQHLAAITDPAFPDPPYSLIGWAYGSAYNPTVWPVMGCIPSSAWFVHVPGFHRTDGAMDVYPVTESVPGAALGPPALPPADAPSTPAGSFWHPRTWDLHMWIRDGGLPPLLAINRPEGVPGISTTGLFFHPETFE